MKVQLADREYVIEFGYEITYSVPRFAVTRKGREATMCWIKVSPPPDSKEWPVVAEARVVRYHLDPPNRELARKAALTKALAELDRVLPYHPSMVRGSWVSKDEKERRKLFWQAYLNRKRDASAMQSRVLSAPSTETA